MSTAEVGRPFSNPNSLGVVVGLFHDQANVDRALVELNQAGFTDGQLDIQQGEAQAKVLNGGILGTLGRLLGVEKGKYRDFVDSMTHLGITEDQAHYLEAHFKDGDEILTVAAEDRADEALAILKRNGADTDIGEGAGPLKAASALDLDVARQSEQTERSIP